MMDQDEFQRSIFSISQKTIEAIKILSEHVRILSTQVHILEEELRLERQIRQNIRFDHKN